MNQKTNPNTKKLLDFLHNIFLPDSNVDDMSPMLAIIEFINGDITEGIADKIIDKLDIDIDFHSYFKDMESVNELIKLKETDIDTYYKVIHFENIILNIMVSVVNCPYIIVLNPDNLHKSYYLQLRFK